MRDEKGREMHKSSGNSIPFEEAAAKMGADVMRWVFARHIPQNNLNFGYSVGDAARRRFVLPLWNIYYFFTTYARSMDGHRQVTPRLLWAIQTEVCTQTKKTTDP